VCECGSEQVALEGGFGAWEDVGWCGWVLEGLRCPPRAKSGESQYCSKNAVTPGLPTLLLSTR